MKCLLLSGSVLRVLFTIVAVTCAPLLASAQNYAWKNVVIKGGGFVSGIVYHPTEAHLFYARTDVGGAFRWQNATGSWLPITDHLGKDDSQLTGIVSLALDPNEANRVYLACGQYLPSWGQNAAILRSADRGATWSRTDLPLKLGGNSDGRSTGERLQVDPNRGSVLFLGTNQDGLWKSTDSGQSWSKVIPFTPTSTTLVLFDPRTSTSGNATQTIYVGVNSTVSASLYRSTDGGVSWAAVPGIPAGVLPHHAKLGADGMLYVTFSNGLGPNGISSGSVWRLKTSDGTWTNITPQPAGQGGFAGLALDALHPGTLVVTTINRWWPGDEVFRSTDSGATWKALNLQTSPRDGASAPYSTTSSPHWLGAIEIDPLNAARAFFITGYGLFSTDNLTAADTNGTVSWTFRNDGLEETVPLGIVSPPSGAPLVSVIGDIDGFRHDDLTVSPVQGRHSVSVGTNNSIDFAELAPEKMVRTHSGGTVRGSRSVDGGTTWTYFAGGPAPAVADAPGVIAISADGTRIVWAPSRAVAYVSADNGATWTVSNGGPAAQANTNHAPVADRVNAAKFYVYDSVNGRVHVSTDGGSSFVQAATGLPTGGDPVRAVFGQEGHLWLTTWGSGLYRSTNSGTSFAPVAGVQEAYRVGFGKAATGQNYPAIYLWGKIGGVTGFFRSDDESATWTRLNDDAHQYGWINFITGDPRIYGRVYLATGGRGIIYGEMASSAPSFTTQPISQTVIAGVSVTFSTAATGDPAPTYQWQKDGVAIGGATGSSYTITNATVGEEGSYTVVATNSAGAVTSNPAVLAVIVAPGNAVISITVE